MIVDWIVDNLLPIAIVNEDEMGVRMKHGRYSGTVGPGFYWVIPIIDEIQTITVTPQVIDMEDQIIEVGGKPCFISVSVTYSVDDPFKALLCVQDYDEAIQTQTMNLVYEHDGDTELVEDEISTIAEEWGLRVSGVSINQQAACRVFKLVQ